MEQNSSPSNGHSGISNRRRTAERACGRIADMSSLAAFEAAEQALAGAGFTFSVVAQTAPASTVVSPLASAA